MMIFLFLLLISVSGIGAKAALNMLSTMSAADLTRAIAQKNATLLTKIPGIGKKTAERVILELADKMSFDESDTGTITEILPPEGDTAAETTAALLALGYTRAEISPLLKKTAKAKTVQDAIKIALKELSRKD